MRLIRVPPFLLACSLAIGGTLAGFGVMHVVPQVEQAILNWQAASFSSGPEGSRVVLVSAPIGHDRLCSPGRWHPAEFETMILAIRQAGASAIASLEDFSPDSGLRCGDLGSLAHLAETTTRVGHVLYPDTAPDMLQQAAVGIGSVLPAFDGGLLEEAPSLGSTGQEQLLPVGVAAAVYVLNYGQGSWSFPGGDYQVLLPDRVSVDVPMASFETIRDLFQSGERDRLAAMFQGKIAVVSAEEGAPSQTLRGAGLSSTVPVLHAKLTQAVLSHAWLLVVPLLWAILLTMLAAVWLAYESLRSQRTSRFRWVVPGILLFGLAGLGWLPQAGWAWPMGGTILSLSLTTAASLLWRMLHNQAGLESRIQEVQRTLARLQDDLRGKQQCVRDLELKLARARSAVQASDSVISELQESQETILRQLRDSESAVDSTRDRIHHLQHELASLRQHVPAALPSMAVTETSGCQALIQECEGFNILTRDPHLLDLFERLKRAAVTHSPILLLGETGTGKEVFARAAHALSPRRLGPFVSVNMAAIRPELFEGELFGHVKGAFTGAVGRVGLLQAANGGTLFLDEVGELPADVQAKLLRVLEDGVFYRVGESRETRVNVRIVAATNRNLEMEIEAGRYREDLYYRLRSIVLTLPPLRERIPEDRRILARAFLAMVGTQQGRDALGFSQGAMDAIVAYHWPGNVRELRQTIGQAVALTVGNLITEDDLRLPTPQLTMKIGRAHGQNDLDRHEDLMVLQCLRRHRFDMQGTARELGWDRSTVTQRLKGLGFQALVEHRHDVSAAARELAGEEALVRVVEARLREYAKNILPSSKTYDSAEQAIADCRKRFRNLPERHFPAVERFIHERFSAAPSQAS